MTVYDAAVAYDAAIPYGGTVDSGVAIDPTVFPQVAVELDMGRTGAFVIGSSLIGGPDLLGTTTPEWVQVPCEAVMSVGVRRGRTREDQPVQPGELAVMLDNRTGAYDPDNPASPWRYGGHSVLTRGLVGRVRATWDGVDFVLFIGRLARVEADQTDRPVVVLRFEDGLAWLGQQFLSQIPGNYTADPTATRVGRVLDLAGWSATARSLTGSRQMLTTGLGASALALCEEAARAEFGRFFVSRTGVATLQPYEARFSTAYRFTLSDSGAENAIGYDSIRTTPGADYLANEVTVEQDSERWQTRRDDASIDLFGLRSRTVKAPLYSDTEAATLAQIIVDANAYPSTRVERVEFDAVALGPAWAGLLASDLGDQAMVERTTIDGRSGSWTSLIESLSHDITATSWRVSVDLSPSTRAGIFTIGQSLIGGPDVLWY